MYIIGFLIYNINGETMKLEDIMTKDMIVLDYDTSIYDISNIMKKYDIGFIPINKKNKIIGVITDRDIVCRCIANNCDIDDVIEPYITNKVIHIDIESKLEDVINTMGKNKIKRIIISKDKKMVGIISLSDITSKSTDANLIHENIKKIFPLNKNTDKYLTEIDDFYL